MGIRGFRDLKVWQESKALAVLIYKITDNGSISRDFGLRDQMRRSAVSISSNIAEGDERGTDKEAVRFFYIAKGSLAELITQMEIACEVGYLAQENVKKIDNSCHYIGKMLGALIKARG